MAAFNGNTGIYDRTTEVAITQSQHRKLKKRRPVTIRKYLTLIGVALIGLSAGRSID